MSLKIVTSKQPVQTLFFERKNTMVRRKLCEGYIHSTANVTSVLSLRPVRLQMNLKVPLGRDLLSTNRAHVLEEVRVFGWHGRMQHTVRRIHLGVLQVNVSKHRKKVLAVNDIKCSNDLKVGT